MNVFIRKLEPADREGWSHLWQGYLEFYETELSDQQTELTWQRLLDHDFGMNGLVAKLDDKVAGLAHYSFTQSSWELNGYLYLEDLFVSPEVRGRGLGKALILALDDVAKAAGVNRVYWETHRDNQTARKLYDSVAEVSEFVKYTRQVRH